MDFLTSFWPREVFGLCSARMTSASGSRLELPGTLAFFKKPGTNCQVRRARADFRGRFPDFRGDLQICTRVCGRFVSVFQRLLRMLNDQIFDGTAERCQLKPHLLLKSRKN